MNEARQDGDGSRRLEQDRSDCEGLVIPPTTHVELRRLSKGKGIGRTQKAWNDCHLSGIVAQNESADMSFHRQRLLVQGWRGIAHSYALVNQFQLVEFSRIPGLELFHQDAAFFGKHWSVIPDLFPAETEDMIRSVPAPPVDLLPDAVLRIAYPYDFTPLPQGRLVVFGTAECSICPKDSVVGAGNGKIGEALEDSNATLLTPSEWSRRGFIRSGANPERVKVVPHGVDGVIFRPALSPEEKAKCRGKLGLKLEDFIFLNIGSLTFNKGILILIKAFVAIAATNPNARLVLKYNESLYSAKAFINSLPGSFSEAERALLSPRIQLIGGVHAMTDLASLYQAADAYVTPYHAEAFNLPALEACACGLPVIATAGGPTDEFLPEGVLLPIASHPLNIVRDGMEMIVLQADSDSLARQMNAVMSDPGLVQRALKVGPRHAVGKLSWKNICARIVQVALE